VNFYSRGEIHHGSGRRVNCGKGLKCQVEILLQSKMVILNVTSSNVEIRYFLSSTMAAVASLGGVIKQEQL